MTNDQLTKTVHDGADTAAFFATLDAVNAIPEAPHRERSHDMTVFREALPVRSASLTTSQLESVQRVWQIAGLPAVSGFAATFLAMAVASAPIVAATLTTVDFDDVESVTNAVNELVRWRAQAFRAMPVA
jgi:hypothetical protein